MAAVSETIHAINEACKSRSGPYAQYSCKSVSWDDVQRGTVAGGLSCWGANITDTRLWAKDGRQLFTVRSDNWNEKLGVVSAGEVAVVAGNRMHAGPDADETQLRPITLRELMSNMGSYGGYAGLPSSTDLSDASLDAKVSIRFQTTFLPVGEEELASLEFCSEAYNYNTTSDSDPRNLVLLCTSQGLAVQQDGSGAKRLFHHAVDRSGAIHRYWLEAERSRHKVGGPQRETNEERSAALARGKATASVIGVRAMGTRFNVLMTIQVPLRQAMPKPRKVSGSMGKSKGKLGKSWISGPFPKCAKSLGTPAFMLEALDGCNDLMSEYEQYQDATAEEEGEGSSDDSDDRCIRSSCRSATRVGTATAARVSRGSEVDIWSGVTVQAPKRSRTEHVTCTVVIYNTISGGVPSEADVVAAIDDMEQLYSSCGAGGRLSEPVHDFMKKELTSEDLEKISDNVISQPYKPPPQAVLGFDAFPV